MTSVHGRAVPTRLATLLLLTFLTGCFSLQDSLPTQPTEEELLIANLRKSVDLLRGSLKTTVRERDQFKQDYISGQAELSTARGDAEYLETRVRLYRDRIVDLENRADERDHTIAEQESQLVQQQGVARSQQETIDRLRNRTRGADNERQELERQVVKAEQSTEKMQARLAQLERTVAESENIVAQAKMNRSQREEALAAQVATLDDELAAAKAEVVAAEQRAAMAAEALAQATVDGPAPLSTAAVANIASNTQSSEPVDAAEFFVSWWSRGLSELRAGEFGPSARSVVTAAGSAIVLIVLLIFLWVRGAGAQKRAHRLDKQLQAALAVGSTTSGIMRRSAATAAAPEAGPPPAHLDATIQIPRTVPDQPEGAAVGAIPDSVSIPIMDPGGANSADAGISESLDNALSSDDNQNPRDRQVIGAPARKEGSTAAQATGADDADLLQDLKSVIREKFQDL